MGTTLITGGHAGLGLEAAMKLAESWIGLFIAALIETCPAQAQSPSLVGR
jgi:short-subunit dehydrogenase involved in D-alanine esterification of teichoic acids